MSTASPAQVQAHNDGNCWYGCRLCEHENAQQPRLSIRVDEHGDAHVWEQSPGARPSPVLWKGDVGDDALWDAIVRIVENGEVQ